MEDFVNLSAYIKEIWYSPTYIFSHFLSSFHCLSICRCNNSLKFQRSVFDLINWFTVTGDNNTCLSYISSKNVLNAFSYLGSSQKKLPLISPFKASFQVILDIVSALTLLVESLGSFNAWSNKFGILFQLRAKEFCFNKTCACKRFDLTKFKTISSGTVFNWDVISCNCSRTADFQIFNQVFIFWSIVLIHSLVAVLIWE